MKSKLSQILFTFIILFGFSTTTIATPEAPTLTYSINGLTVTASWSAVPNATEYKLSYAPIPYTGEASIGSLDVGNTTSFSATLWEGAAFYIAVQSSDGKGFSNYSNIESFTLVTSPTDLTGNWNITETSGPNNCGETQGVLRSYVGSINQTGTSITASFGSGAFSGKLAGNTISLSGSMPEDGGTTSSKMNISVLTTNSLSGSISWTWSGDGESCSGTSSIIGSR